MIRLFRDSMDSTLGRTIWARDTSDPSSGSFVVFLRKRSVRTSYHRHVHAKVRYIRSVEKLREIRRTGLRAIVLRVRLKTTTSRNGSPIHWDDPEPGIYVSAPAGWDCGQHRVWPQAERLRAMRSRKGLRELGALLERFPDEPAIVLRAARSLRTPAEHLRYVRSLPETKGFDNWLGKRRSLAFQGYLLATR